jgi:hypothetical protein
VRLNINVIKSAASDTEYIKILQESKECGNSRAILILDGGVCLISMNGFTIDCEANFDVHARIFETVLSVHNIRQSVNLHSAHSEKGTSRAHTGAYPNVGHTLGKITSDRAREPQFVPYVCIGKLPNRLKCSGSVLNELLK